MSTQPRPQPVTRREMEEVKAPEMFQFSDQHRTLSGVLIDIDQVTVKGKPTMQYTLQGDDRRRYTFLSTYDLQRKITPDHVGHFLTITYEGEDQTVQTQGSPLRKFKVQASKEKENGF